jgi:hypothetical protein
MSSESRHRISAIYHSALERPAEERSAFLQEACDGNDALRKEVESLLRFEPTSARFLEQPAGAGLATIADCVISHLSYMESDGARFRTSVTGVVPATAGS